IVVDRGVAFHEIGRADRGGLLGGHLEVVRRPLDEGFQLLFLQHGLIYSLMRSAMASFSCRSVKGLLRKPLAPFSIASTAVALSASAEITRMRTAGFSSTSLEMHSMPSICGIVKSIVTTSGSCCLNSSSASRPLPAVPT